MNLLIVEDDATSRLVLERAATRCGHTPRVACDGLEAWALFQQSPVSVIISDWMMPGIDGVELCRRVRAHPDRTIPYTYFIMLTGLTDQQHMLAAMQEGVDDYLTKPLNQVDLQVRLNVAARVTTLYQHLARQQIELERSNAELTQFTSVASHDLRSPLGVISGYSRMLQQSYASMLNADANQYLGRIISQVEHMQLLIDELLAYARVGAQQMTPRRVDCRVLVARAMANLQAAIAASGAQITSEDLPMLDVDAMQLAQVFQNLIQNAITYCRAQVPRVRISAEQRDSDWLLRVQDNGIGIDPGAAERIFGLFERLHSMAAYPGTGLGLAICKKIVERHGGRIWVESEPGHGATFLFTLPATAVAAARTA
jgi:light-regulated signal transduction histidine kinase (bacteriophytochrome)